MLKNTEYRDIKGRVWMTDDHGVFTAPLDLMLPLVSFPLAFLSFGFVFDLGGAWFGHRDGLLTVDAEESLHQSARAALCACGCVTLAPVPKLILAVGSKVFLPVAGHSAFDFLGLLTAGAFPRACSTVSVIGHTTAKAPLRTVRTTLTSFILLFLVFPRLCGHDH